MNNTFYVLLMCDYHNNQFIVMYNLGDVITQCKQTVLLLY